MERIVLAAIKFCVDRDKEGKTIIMTGKRHAEIEEDIYFMLGSECSKPYDKICGFITSEGRFVDRYDAKIIAVAANQLIVPLEETCNHLFSEDVYQTSSFILFDFFLNFCYNNCRKLRKDYVHT